MTSAHERGVFSGVEALLFDLDGVLVDSTASIERAWRSWAETSAVAWESVLPHVHGRRAVETVSRVFPEMSPERVRAEADAVNALQVLDPRIDAVRGARELLATLPARAWAVVTASPADLALARLRYAGFTTPRVMVAAADVEVGKPDPACYLLAARRIGAEPSRCLVVEDAPSGVRAAKNAGMRCLALLTTHAPEDVASADAVIGDLAGIRIAENGVALTVDVRGAR
jgi:mannitol-1-/sugar-/sorbitol-6-phosphatase